MRTIGKYAIAIGLVLAASAIAASMSSVIEPTTLLLASILIAAWYGGLGPGLLAAVTALAADEYLFTEPLYSLTPRLAHVPHLIAFAALAALSAWASAARKKAERSLREARDELDRRVVERTAELTRSNERLAMQFGVARVLADATSLEAAMPQVLRVIGESAGWEWGAFWAADPARGVLECKSSWEAPGLNTERFNAAFREVQLRPGHGLPGIVSERRRPLWIADVTADPGFLRERGAADASLHSAIGFPVIVSGELLGAIEFFSRVVRQPDPQQLDSFAALGTQIGQFVSRTRDQQALEDLAGRLIQAQEDERRRIGRELHDHISQTLGVLTIKIDQLRGDGSVPPGVMAALDELRHDATEITTDVHRLSHRLHSSTLDYLGLVPALQKLAAEFAARYDVAMELSHDAVPSGLPSEVALCLFRVSEEALNNVARHSGARSGRIELTHRADGLHLTIHDEGRGFDPTRPQQRPGLGLISMQERLRAVRGTVRVESAPASGATVRVWVPSASLGIEAASDAQASDRAEPATTA